MSDLPGLHLAPVPDETTGPPRRVKPKLKKRRLLAVLLPLAALAVVSTVFGMMMAVAADLPSLEQLPQVAKRQNSILYDRNGKQLATLTSNQGRIIVTGNQIGDYVKYAVVAIEDRRFYENSGVDIRGIGRALVQDIIQKRSAQGGSTIAQQFVKNAMQAQHRRTVFEKLREAALAYHLTRKWSKERILAEYLNSVYFGNGAYGVEAAARTYFGADPNHAGCGTPGHTMCADQLDPAEAALLAAIIASPSGYDPEAHADAAMARRNVVLGKMLEQDRITRAQYDQAIHEPLFYALSPPRLETVPGTKGTEYFVSWVRQSLVDHVGPQRAFEGNLRVTTTLDLDLQRAAQQAIDAHLSSTQGPTASMVVLDNATGEVKAMVGGRDYRTQPFNLATQGQRQPGSAMKPFILAEALRKGVSPSTVFPSRPRVFTRRGERFVVNNFKKQYVGHSTVANALTNSDNSVFAALGIRVGTKNVARMANRLGIRTPISTNYAMTLGGLRQGVTPLDMAHAYETFAAHGRRITGTLGTSEDGPVGIRRIERPRSDGKGLEVVAANQVEAKPVMKRKLADLETQLLTGPVRFGTATRAQYGGFAAGKTGTTENSGDAWFVGFTDRWTIAVWVGYPNGLKPMLTEFGGQPVTGGTFPTVIWHDFVVGANAIIASRLDKERIKRGLPPLSATTPASTATPASPSTSTSTSTSSPARTTPKRPAATGDGTVTPSTGAPAVTEAPTPAPVAPQPTPAEPTTPDPGAGGGTSGATGGTGAG